MFLEAIAAIVGCPGQEAVGDVLPASWLDELPFFKKWYGQSGQAWLKARAETAQPWPPRCLEGCPEGLVQLIQKCLVWHPSARMTAADAKNNSFLQPPGQLPLHVLLTAKRARSNTSAPGRGNHARINGWCFREHIFGILVKVQVLWEGQYYLRPFPKTVFEEVRKLVKDYRWSKWASSLCEPSWGKPQG